MVTKLLRFIRYLDRVRLHLRWILIGYLSDLRPRLMLIVDGTHEQSQPIEYLEPRVK